MGMAPLHADHLAICKVGVPFGDDLINTMHAYASRD